MGSLSRYKVEGLNSLCEICRIVLLKKFLYPLLRRASVVSQKRLV